MNNHVQQGQPVDDQIETPFDIEQRDAGGTILSASGFLTSYRERNDIFGLFLQLNQLVKSVQLHRGISLGLLAGDKSQLDKFERLQTQIDKRLNMIQLLSADSEVLSTRDKDNTQMEWNTIRQNWQEDNLADNFELHSHFIEHILGLISVLAKYLESPMDSAVDSLAEHRSESIAYPKAFKKIEVLNFIAKQLPVMIEFIAQIRGLSAYATTLGSVGDGRGRKIKYLLQCAREHNEKLRHRAVRLNEIVEGKLTSLTDMGDFELKQNFLFTTIESDLLSGNTISASAPHLFDLASLINDGYWEVVFKGIELIKAWHEEDMEAFINHQPS